MRCLHKIYSLRAQRTTQKRRQKESRSPREDGEQYTQPHLHTSTPSKSTWSKASMNSQRWTHAPDPWVYITAPSSVFLWDSWVWMSGSESHSFPWTLFFVFLFFSFLFNFFCPVLSCLVFVWYYILLFKNVIIKKEKCRKRSFKIRACRHEVQMVECLTTSFRQLKKW